MSSRAASIIFVQASFDSSGGVVGLAGGAVGFSSFGRVVGAAEVVHLASDQLKLVSASPPRRLACLRGKRRRVRRRTSAQPKRHVPVTISAKRMALTSSLPAVEAAAA
eukprot:GHVU01132264.1.p2 GENE.GHVU01132264.1~~GHVU01132264.1.p2  ORF type:complete len:108 (-),score=6.97 GHVU01132264.1:366-689(-)